MKNENAKERVELHLHTVFSAKDGCSDIEKVIEKAIKSGHKSVAITDHGVVQGFPTAFKIAQKMKRAGKPIKILYGMEGYLPTETKKRNHIILFAKNKTGLKNLYKLVTFSSTENYNRKPLLTKEKIAELRAGLIIGSACESGELFCAVHNGLPFEKLCEIASFYDYLEVEPLCNNMFYVKNGWVESENVLIAYNKKIIEIGEKLNIPVCAAGDVHFVNKEDGIVRKVLSTGLGFEDAEKQPPLYFRTTEEMLKEFSYLSPEKAEEIVITNPNKIADSVEELTPIPQGYCGIELPNAYEDLEQIVYKNSEKLYGKRLPLTVQKRICDELNIIKKNDYASLFMISYKLVQKSNELGYAVLSRGCVGSSFVAFLMGITEVNPLPAHYVCKNCHHFEFSDNAYSGFDLSTKKCPYCGENLYGDGQDIPYETFFGFSGDKIPDIDLNFADEIKPIIDKTLTEILNGSNACRAGTISIYGKWTAQAFIEIFEEKYNINFSKEEKENLITDITKVKKCDGIHPCGFMAIPKGFEVEDFTPLHKVNGDNDCIASHFNFHSLYDTVDKIDILGHTVPTIIHDLEELTGVKYDSVPMNDKEVYLMFNPYSPEGLDTLCLPEFSNNYVRNMLTKADAENFSDLVKVSGLSHGTDIWFGNTETLVDSGFKLKNLPACRDDIMNDLIKSGIDKATAFKITETVRKGFVAKGKIQNSEWAEMINIMDSHEIADWYIEALSKIRYLFPKAHAATYVTASVKLAWYKKNYPLEFYCAYFSSHREEFWETFNADEDSFDNYEISICDIILEVRKKGISFAPPKIRKSHPQKFIPDNGKIRIPLAVLPETNTETENMN